MSRPHREVHAFPGRVRGRERWPFVEGAGPCSGGRPKSSSRSTRHTRGYAKPEMQVLNKRRRRERSGRGREGSLPGRRRSEPFKHRAREDVSLVSTPHPNGQLAEARWRQGPPAPYPAAPLEFPGGPAENFACQNVGPAPALTAARRRWRPAGRSSACPTGSTSVRATPRRRAAPAPWRRGRRSGCRGWRNWRSRIGRRA